MYGITQTHGGFLVWNDWDNMAYTWHYSLQSFITPSLDSFDEMVGHDMAWTAHYSTLCTTYWRAVLTIKHFFLNPFRLHNIVEQTLWCDSSFFFIALCFLRELVFNRALSVELLKIEKWINPSLRVWKRNRDETRREEKRSEPKKH